jgi:hypothetical protein
MKNRLGRYVAAVSIILAAGFTFYFSVNTASADAAAKHIVFYKIDAKLKLDEQQRPTIVEGHELLTWLNDSPDAVGEMQLHLYLNAFKNQKSTFFVESRGESRENQFEPGEWGWIDINSMKVEDGEDATKKIEFIHPDDDNKDDQTVIRVPLAKPVPGGKILST